MGIDPTYIMKKKAVDESAKAKEIQSLIAQAKTGDLEAFEAVYRYHSRDVYTMAMRMVNSPDIAEEVTQEVFISVYKNIHRFEFQSAFTTWLYRITSRRVADYFRKNKKHFTNTVPMPSVEDGGQVFEAEDPKPVPSEVALQNEKRELIEQMIHTLNPKHSSILFLRYSKMMSYDEISEVLQCRIGTVKSRLNRAHKMLEEKLRKVLPNT